MASLKDVARSTGLSTATVSRALHGRDVVAAPTRARVLAAAERLGYVRSAEAVTLVSGRSRVVAAVLPAQLRWASVVCLEVVERVLQRHGYDLLLRLDGDRAGSTPSGTTRRVDGVVLLPAAGARPGPDAGITADPPTVSVAVDEVAAGRLAAEHLLRAGHHDVRFVGTCDPRGRADPGDPVAARYRGVTDAVLAAGLRPLPPVDSALSVNGGRRAARRVLDGTLTASAVVAACDEVAFGFVHELRGGRVTVPGDLSVVVVGDDPRSAPTDLTTVRLPYVEQAAAATEWLVRRLDRRSPPTRASRRSGGRSAEPVHMLAPADGPDLHDPPPAPAPRPARGARLRRPARRPHDRTSTLRAHWETHLMHLIRRLPDSHAPGPWWRDAVVYEVYPRSFADSDGDGEGDLPGLIERLPHIARLGADAIWLTPWYPSPMADGGYDVSDYYGIHPRLGTLDDADALLERAHELGLRVLVDLVANHTSIEHPWFAEALASPPGSPARRRYFFRDGRGRDGEEPPNDWISAFRGRAWTRSADPDGTPGQWYLHLFSPEQPDLDWTEPSVVEEFDRVLRFWFDRGVDGVRIDAASAMGKDPTLPDAGHAPGAAFDTRSWTDSPHWDRPEVHDILRRWRRIADGYAEPRLLVSEAVVSHPDRLAAYVRPDEMHQTFNFDLLLCPWDRDRLVAAVDDSLRSHASVGAVPTWVLSSHDETRHRTRFTPTGADGPDAEEGLRRARAAVLLLLGLPGAVYLYQGEELGLEQVVEIPDELRQDPVFARSGGADPGRDGCRVPIPWEGDEPPFGFGPLGSRPWLPQPPGWARLTAARQWDDPHSVLRLYARALRIRRELAVGRHAALAWADLGPDALSYRLGTFACTLNLGPDPLQLPPDLGLIVMHSDYSPLGRVVPPSSAVWTVSESSTATIT